MFFIGGLIMLMTLDLSFGIIMLCALPVMAIMLILVLGKAIPIYGTVQKKLDKLNCVVQENVTGARVIKAYVKEDYEAKRRIAENEAARTTLLNMPQFADLKGKEGDLDKIIAGTPLLQGATPDQRYMLAALISRGMNSGRQMTTEELHEKASANPDVMKALEARRVAEIQQNNASLPKVVPSSGAGNANAVPEEKPTNVEGVRNMLYSRLGLRR
jgi:ABC-type multidrug transport system fused ATPase/permease subunit